MLDRKTYQSLKNAAPDDRYRHFLSRVAQSGRLWLLGTREHPEDYATYEAEGTVHLLVWPDREFCQDYVTEGEMPVSLGVHDFLIQCCDIGEEYRLMVFPNEVDAYVVPVEKFREDMLAALSEPEE